MVSLTPVLPKVRMGMSPSRTLAGRANAVEVLRPANAPPTNVLRSMVLPPRAVRQLLYPICLLTQHYEPADGITQNSLEERVRKIGGFEEILEKLPTVASPYATKGTHL